MVDFCQYPVKDSLCGREFVLMSPRQVVCPTHSLARRIALQRERSAANRRTKARMHGAAQPV